LPLTLSPTQSDIQTALRAFLLNILPSGSAVFTATIAGTVLRVTSLLANSGLINVGDLVLGQNVAPETTVQVAIDVDPMTGLGTYQVSPGQTVALSTTMWNGVPVVAGQVNRVAEPQQGDFVTMTTLRRVRLETNIDTYADVLPAGNNTYRQATEVMVQLDVHGPNSHDFAEVISTMFRDSYATDFFLSYPGITSLYSEDLRQIAFVNAEAQYENRYVIEVLLQADQVVTGVTQQFADILSVDLIDVETTYP
jgi:hypothetical protein